MTKKNVISQYLRNLRERHSATYSISPLGVVTVYYKGATLTQSAFHEMFPLMLTNVRRREDIDGRRKWMADLPKTK